MKSHIIRVCRLTKYQISSWLSSSRIQKSRCMRTIGEKMLQTLMAMMQRETTGGILFVVEDATMGIKIHTHGFSSKNFLTGIASSLKGVRSLSTKPQKRSLALISRQQMKKRKKQRNARMDTKETLLARFAKSSRRSRLKSSTSMMPTLARSLISFTFILNRKVTIGGISIEVRWNGQWTI